MRHSTFGIFDAFPNEEGRQAHRSGRIAAALIQLQSERERVIRLMEPAADHGQLRAHVRRD
jgi:hypothetical protein